MRPTTRYRLKLFSAVALAAVGLGCALSTALAVAMPAKTVPIASSLGAVREARADGAARNGVQSGAATSLNNSALKAAPMSTSALLRAVYLQTRTGTAPNAASLDALERSYSVAPFGPDASLWRLRFVFDHWSQVTPSLRKQALAELDVLSYHRGRVFKTEDIVDPQGRFIAEMNTMAALNQRAIRVAVAKVAR